MRVLINYLSAFSGGAISYARHLTPRLSGLFYRSDRKNELRVLAHVSQADLLASASHESLILINGEQPLGYRRVFWEWRHVPRIVAERGIDVLFTPYQIGPRVNGAKNVLMLRNMEPFLHSGYTYSKRSRLRNQLLRRASLRSLHRADRVIAVSGFAQELLTDKIGVNSDRICKVYHGRCEHSAFHRNTEVDRIALDRFGVRNRYIFTGGSLLPYRRCEDVIVAFNRCADTLPVETQLVIAGAGTDRCYGALIRRTIAASPYHDRILALGHVSSSMMAALYRQCLAFIMASEIEACPNIAIEAMAAGCAIVSSDCPPLPEMFQGASLEYGARNIDQLAGQIRLAATNAALRSKMQGEARKRAAAFSWEKCAKETYAALTDW